MTLETVGLHLCAGARDGTAAWAWTMPRFSRLRLLGTKSRFPSTFSHWSLSSARLVIELLDDPVSSRDQHSAAVSDQGVLGRGSAFLFTSVDELQAKRYSGRAEGDRV